MCRLIVRRFECWETSPGLRAGSPTGHEKKFLARCANPNFTACIKPTALPWLQEWYKTACPDCLKSGVHPSEAPIRTLAPTDDVFETDPHARNAALAYAMSLCSFVSNIFDNCVVSEYTVTKRFARASFETLCQINPQHFSNNTVFCGCDDSNHRPSVRNVSQALRFHIVNHLLSAPDDEICFGHITAGAPPDLSVCRRAAAPYLTAFRDELNLSSYGDSNPDLRDAEVLSRWMPFEGTSHSYIMDHLQKLDGLAALATINLGGEEPWIAHYLAARNLDQDDDSHFVQAENSYRQRQCLLSIWATLIAADSGLALGRMSSVFRLLLDVLDSGPVDPAGSSLGEDFVSLAEGQTWNIVRDDMHPRECMGSIFSNPVRLHTLLRQAAEEGETLISIDLARTSAATLAIDRELTEAEFIAIRRSGVEELGYGLRCFICGSEMTHGPGQPPSSSHPEGDSRAHRAVYLHCEHVVGRDCFIWYWRQTDNRPEYIHCPLCREVFGPWPQAVEVAPFWDLV